MAAPHWRSGLAIGNPTTSIFFSSVAVDSTRLLHEVPYIRGAEVLQRSPDTLTCLVDRGGPVRVSFFGGLTLRRVADPDSLAAPAVTIASLLDLAAKLPKFESLAGVAPGAS